MFRIRRIFDDNLSINRSAVAQIQKILRERFPFMSEEEISALPDKMRDPLKHRFRSILFVADDLKARVRGFAMLLHAPDLGFCFLDYISTATRISGRGLGGALYQRVRREAVLLKCAGLFFECLPDDPRLCSDPRILRENAARLRFYEQYSARPVTGTAYETPLSDVDDCPPYLVYDGLGMGTPLRRDKARRIVRAILERKYRDLCPRSYIDMVAASFRDDPVRLRPPRYLKKTGPEPPPPDVPEDLKILLLVNDRHAIHHVRERGYVESPVRVPAILQELDKTRLFRRVPARRFPERHIQAVHDSKYIDYFKRVCANLKPGQSIYPYVFPIRNNTRPPRLLAVRAGYYCIDTFTPLNRNAYLAARAAVDNALTGALALFEGARAAYALIRPPGHHAERRFFGGFCYFNSAAVAAHWLSAHGRTAVLDIDYHHGNGQQNIFYTRDDVLTVSIHGHPRAAYPYFSGFAEEKGEGPGWGFNLNFPLPENLETGRYLETLDQALAAIRKFRPDFLVVALGLDTAKKDPTGSWNLERRDFKTAGRRIGGIGCPTLIVQEGGYNTRNLGINARWFFTGLWEGANSPAAESRRPAPGRGSGGNPILPSG